MSKYDPARRRLKTLERFGLTPEKYEMLLRLQNGACALCLRPAATARALDVDHDHRTGAIRGLLCHRCNRGLGYIQSPEVLRRAVEYVQKHTGYWVPKKKRRRAA